VALRTDDFERSELATVFIHPGALVISANVFKPCSRIKHGLIYHISRYRSPDYSRLTALSNALAAALTS
jgi:hypothetical protein